MNKPDLRPFSMKFHNRKIVLTVLFPLILLFFGLIAISPKNFFLTRTHTNQIQTDSVISITFSVVGDLMCHSPEYQYAKAAPDSFDFRPFFKFVKPILTKSDVSFGNLETVLAGVDEEYSGYPFFNSPDEFLYAIKDAGFTHLTTANNHCLDRGEKGILRTIEMLQNAEIPYVGTSASTADKDSIRAFTKNGLSFALLAYSYSTNGNPVPKGKEYLVSLIDTARIAVDVKSAKTKSDIIIVSLHFGEEYKRKQSRWQEIVVDKAIEAGADIIIGSHPHVIQPGRQFHSDNSRLDTGLVVYSLGNFISNQQERYKDAGVILHFTVEKNLSTKKYSLNNVGFTSTWVFKGMDNQKQVYYILPEADSASYAAMPFLNYFAKKRMLQAFSDTKMILGGISSFRKNP